MYAFNNLHVFLRSDKFAFICGYSISAFCLFWSVFSVCEIVTSIAKRPDAIMLVWPGLGCLLFAIFFGLTTYEEQKSNNLS